MTKVNFRNENYDEVFNDDDGYPIKKTKELIKLLERLIKQDHLYSQENIKEMKNYLNTVKQQVAEYEKENSKGFGK